MGGDAGLLELAQWRRQTAELYAVVRGASGAQAAAVCIEFRRRRDEMFASHPQSPLDAQQKEAFRGLSYFLYNPALRFRVPVLPFAEAQAAGAPPPTFYRAASAPRAHLAGHSSPRACGR